ncbi:MULTISPECIES: hypothetical protein [unclassified Tolypothrix]|uniref:hypothetical protein n=1 Tax=unclassified Tolypothrix TaxID=2649714 RepID=UPI0005EAA9E3|nr:MULTISPECIES: hypothetical protein [unclassified Tolypothrix]BAY93667.1 hypothetical protein NIES3275_57090 [Microchaete diplosiphon NIES-3275]EKE99531.1 hypothetical protein FDUTEX481_09791 [Tolypothrix sp. PCC 7601]MBE9081720.1 hypothetical protein [Tolypothrix sp. LEGE 11397]UYD27487.1 hypothetical protein HGR01_05200 [Tolypothrix sp. PCC 7712]UYD36649.1 hypothetical protein HG267_13510 [Tolypothrix sp. PCC 7601]
MAEVLAEPQFQIFTHIKTGAKVGRIYFPALFLAEFHATVYQWLQRQEIIFDKQDIKQYGDGSFRLYFRSANSLETEYFRLVKPLTVHESKTSGLF